MATYGPAEIDIDALARGTIRLLGSRTRIPSEWWTMLRNTLQLKIPNTYHDEEGELRYDGEHQIELAVRDVALRILDILLEHKQVTRPHLPLEQKNKREGWVTNGEQI